MTNVTMALQISQKRQKKDNAYLIEILNAGGRRMLSEEDLYGEFVNLTQRYLIIKGMYELKN